jgi:hypothetical protein
MKRAVLVAAAMGVAAATAPAVAGLDKLHKQRAEGGRVCFSDHWHFKSSGAWPTRAEAESAVLASWRRFTAAEYGAAWGDPGTAAGAKMECASGTNSRGATWSCNFKARPCRR